MSLLELYTEVILQHNKNPHNVGEIFDADIDVKGYNKSCGDDIRMYVSLEGEVVREIKFVGRGCAISQSSASMMTDRMKGKTLADAMKFLEEFKQVIHAEKEFPDTEDFRELTALKGVWKFPNRAKCASLAWDTLEHGVMDYKANRNGSAT